MDDAVKKHFNCDIAEKTRLEGGYTFHTWLLTFTNGRKVVFRTQKNFKTSSGRDIIITDVFEREAFFYKTINDTIGHVCPNIYLIDGTCEYFEMPYQISEYLPGQRLDLCEDIDIFFKYGELAAKIGCIEIDENHKYITERGVWEEFMANRLYERLFPLVKNDVISLPEINEITKIMRNSKAKKNLSFLHLDMRFVNMIYNNGNIFLIDAENCEFGDPLFELAVIDMSNCINDSFLEGYISVSRKMPDITSDLFHLYKMERLALVYDLFLNVITNDKASTELYATKFKELKKIILG